MGKRNPLEEAPSGVELRTAGPLRIHAVAELTGVPEPTLRAWERRYGIPCPERTSSGYRLYGAREVDEVRRMKELCEAGMAAAEAAALVRTRGVRVDAGEDGGGLGLVDKRHRVGCLTRPSHRQGRPRRARFFGKFWPSYQ